VERTVETEDAMLMINVRTTNKGYIWVNADHIVTVKIVRVRLGIILLYEIQVTTGELYQTETDVLSEMMIVK
jgi:hypothetical protein